MTSTNKLILSGEQRTDLNISKAIVDGEFSVGQKYCNICDIQFESVVDVITHFMTPGNLYGKECELDYYLKIKQIDVTVSERNISEKTAYDKMPETYSSQPFYPSMFSGALSTENISILPTIDDHTFVRTYLNEHSKTSTGEITHQCTVCNKTCSHRSRLDVHMRIHTGEKPHQCAVCNKKFAQSGTLNRHIATHFEERPHQCPECNKTYKVRDYLMRHRKTHTM